MRHDPNKRVEWQELLLQELQRTLSKTKVSSKGIPEMDFWSPKNPIIKLVLDKKARYLGEDEILFALAEKIIDYFFESEVSHAGDSTLGSILTGSQMDKLCINLADFFAAIPKQYKLLIELPSLENVDHVQNFNLTDKVKLIKCVGSKNFDGFSPWTKMSELASGNIKIPETIERIQSGIYLTVDTSGYAYDFDSETAIDGLSTAKQTLMLLKYAGCIDFKRNYGHSSVRRPCIYLLEVGLEKEPKQLNVSDSLSAILSRIAISTEKLAEIQLYEQHVNDPNVTLTILGSPASPYPVLSLNEKRRKIVDSTLENQNAISMKNALAWAFDSLMNEHDKTMAFVQTAIALEAILGANSGRNGKTGILADRCSILVGNTVTERAKVKEDFGAFYDVRSEIVHGSTTRLDKKVSHWLNWGQTKLNQIIKRELSFTNFDPPVMIEKKPKNKK